MMTKRKEKDSNPVDKKMTSSLEKVKAAVSSEDVGKVLADELDKLSRDKQNLNKFLKLIISSKSKTTFEDIKNPEVTENLFWIVLDDIDQKYQANNTVVFKFLSGQNITNVKTRALNKKIAEACQQSLGKYLTQDKFIFSLLHKVLAANFEELRPQKPALIEAILSLCFLYFGYLQAKQQRSSLDFLRAYADLLKLFCHFTKDLIELKTSSSLKKQKFVTEETYGHLNCLVELCKLNMFLGSSYGEGNVFGQSKVVSKLMNHPEIRSRLENLGVQKKEGSKGYDEDLVEGNESVSVSEAYSCKSTSESQSDKFKAEHEIEAIDRIKVNSARIMASILKQMPKIFIDNKLWTHIMPSSSISLSKAGLSADGCISQMLLTKGFVDNLKSAYHRVVKNSLNNACKYLHFSADFHKVVKATDTKNSSNLDDLRQKNNALLSTAKTRLLAELRSKGILQ